MLGQRRRRWANIDSTLDLCVMFAGYGLIREKGSSYCYVDIDLQACL